MHGRAMDCTHDGVVRSEHEELLARGSAIAAQIRAAVLQQTSLTVSAAVAPNKLLAKMSVSANKPDGLTVVFPCMVYQMLHGLRLECLPYVGAKTCAVLDTAGLKTCDQVQQLRSWQDQLYDDSPPQLLVQLVGAASADYVWCAAQGVDFSSVKCSPAAKSVSVDLCCRPAPGFKACTEREQLLLVVRQASSQLLDRLQPHLAAGVVPQKLTVKWRWFNQPLSCVSRTCKLAECGAEGIYQTACKLLAEHLADPFELSRLILCAPLPTKTVPKPSKSANVMARWLRKPNSPQKSTNV